MSSNCVSVSLVGADGIFREALRRVLSDGPFMIVQSMSTVDRQAPHEGHPGRR